MSALFSRSLRSLRADSSARAHVVVVLTLAALGAWTYWLFAARVVRVEASSSARLEVGRAAHRVEAPVSGAVSVVHLALGAVVRAGDVLLELDGRPLEFELREKRARRLALVAQIDPLRAEIGAKRDALAEATLAGRAELDEAKAFGREEEVLAHFQQSEAERGERLHDEGLFAESELARLTAGVRAKRERVQARALGVERIDAEQRTRRSSLRAELSRLNRDASSLEGEARALEAAIEALLAALARLRVVAPVAGQIGAITPIQAGAFVHAGDWIAAIVPSGKLKVVAFFSPAALGRIRVGQLARVRLEGFPWTEYGVVHATVESVATESVNALVRVELSVQQNALSAIPMAHGLPGTAVIEVERVSPATLLLRAAGRLRQTGGA